MRDTVNEMLNTASQKRDRIKMIHIDDIRPNQDNKDFPMCDIEAMALSLRVCGQIDPCVVIPSNEGYTLISEWEEISCIIREYDKNELMLIAANGHRESIPVEQKIDITNTVLRHYYAAKEANEIPVGTKKREWISAVTGYSERSVQSYLNKIEMSDARNTEKEAKENIHLKALENHITHKLGTKAIVTDKYIKVNYMGIDDLNRILEIIGLLEEEL